MKWILNNKLECRTPSESVKFDLYRTKYPKVEYDIIPRVKNRTESQNRALHLWLGMVAETLNDGGYSVQLILKPRMDLEWNKDLAKELLWRPMQKALYKKGSTTELKKTDEIDAIYDHLVRHLGEKFGIEVPPFPTEDQLEALDSNFIGNKGIR
jgi:hypothetical protein